MVFLPLCHIFGRDVAVTLPLISRLVPHFGEDAEDLPATLFEVAPTVLFTVPRYLQKFASQMLVGISSTSRAQARRLRPRHADRRAPAHAGAGTGKAGSRTAVMQALARAHRLRARCCDKLGLDQLELVISGGAPLAARDHGALADLGRQPGRGLWADRDRRRLHHRPARPVPAAGQCRHRRAQAGRSGSTTTAKSWCTAPICSRAIWNSPEATQAVFDDDGWLHTGDVGEWRDGTLRLIDRARDFIVTAGGKTISPSFIENILRASPYVAEAIVFGHGRKYLTALIEIDYDSVADWARAATSPIRASPAWCRARTVERLIKTEIDKANARVCAGRADQGVPHPAQGARPRGGGRAGHADPQGEANLMYERFKALVEDMYDDREDALIAAGAGAAR